jgi:alpha-N-arabinofuranosidase
MGRIVTNVFERGAAEHFWSVKVSGVAVVIVAAVGVADARGAGGPAAESVAIDATQVSAPISPYIYGQFIEHLGHCIYGGLWAEMLEDRKFFYPVTGEAPAWETIVPGTKFFEGEGHPYEVLVRSPWMILGDKHAVTMVADGAFTGAHSPALALAGGGKGTVGIMQERLALVAGRDYVGRIVLAADGADVTVDVSLVWGGGTSARQTVPVKLPGSGWKTTPLAFRAGAGTDNGRLEIVARGTGRVRVGTVSLMPADNTKGWRTDTLALVRELAAPVYRWPGGNFVSGYDWRDGIGDRDRRPPRKNPAWKGIEPNDVGLHEFMELMDLVHAEPYVAVNTGLGGSRSAADLVGYANGSATSAMGRLRAQNGHPAPFGVRLWAVGNEMYGEWQLGHMALAGYIAKHRDVVDAMRSVDPKIQPVAVGAVGDWSRAMLGQAPGHMSLISEHLYWQSKPDVVAHVAQVPAEIRRVADAHRAYRRELPALKDKNIKIALDEWNFWYGGNEYGELGVRYFLQDALGIAAGLHELSRQSDLFYMANYAQTVNVIGAIKTTPTAAEMEPTGLALALYRGHFGSIPVHVGGAPKPLDVAAAWTADRKALTVAVVNPEPGRTRRLSLALTGAVRNGRGRRFLLTGRDRYAGNAPGHPRGVTVTETSIGPANEPIEVPPLSVTLLVLEQ